MSRDSTGAFGEGSMEDWAQLINDSVVDDAVGIDSAFGADEPAGVLAGIPMSSYALVSRVSRLGPQTQQEVIEILGDDRLSALLARRWAQNPPTETVRTAWSDDPYGRSLLKLAPNEALAAQEPDATPQMSFAERWRRNASRFVLPEPLGHAAASPDSLPRIFAEDGAKANVRIEARGDRSRFALVLDDTSSDDGYVGVWLDDNSDAPTMVVPLFLDVDGRRAATLWCDYARDIRVSRLAPDDLVGDVLQSVTRGVQAADGLTLSTWRKLARDAGADSLLARAILAGLP